MLQVKKDARHCMTTIMSMPHIFRSLLQDIDRIMKMTDTDGDGSIDYNELCQKVFGQSCD